MQQMSNMFLFYVFFTFLKYETCFFLFLCFYSTIYVYYNYAYVHNRYLLTRL